MNFERQSPALHGKNTDKNEVSIASSYTSGTTLQLILKIIKNRTKCKHNKIPVKLSVVPPMDFSAIDLLKRALGKRNSRTLNRLWKTV